jgi:hypothetical protein
MYTTTILQEYAPRRVGEYPEDIGRKTDDPVFYRITERLTLSSDFTAMSNSRICKLHSDS